MSVTRLCGAMPPHSVTVTPPPPTPLAAGPRPRAAGGSKGGDHQQDRRRIAGSHCCLALAARQGHHWEKKRLPFLIQKFPFSSFMEPTRDGGELRLRSVMNGELNPASRPTMTVGCPPQRHLGKWSTHTGRGGLRRQPPRRQEGSGGRQRRQAAAVVTRWRQWRQGVQARACCVS